MIYIYSHKRNKKTRKYSIIKDFNWYICKMRKERKNTILSETGIFLIDISKLVFGGVILAGIMKYETINSTLLYILGGIIVLICFISGLILVTLSKKE